MDDLNAKIAARRQELARQQEQQKVAITEEAQQRKRAEAAAVEAQRHTANSEKHAVIAQVADEMTAAGVPVSAEKGELAFVTPPPPPLDVQGLKQSAFDRLIKREARRMWTPFENWVVIGCLVAGVLLLPILLIGVLPLTLGLYVGSKTNKRYRRIVRERIEPAITT